MQEESLFVAALEKPVGADRQAFLDAACGGDRRLRARVERLLAAAERTSGILDSGLAALAPGRTDGPTEFWPADGEPVAAKPRTGEATDPPGYQLIEPVGEGGMGAVFRARDLTLARDVAIKLLHPRFAPNGPAAERFLGEAKVTAQLQHPGIPPVHQTGVLPNGRPFLAMKLIKGRTLADLLADTGADRGRRLAEFEKVCEALAYAHDRGVIHRDLKPANVMVGAFGEVQVMDWGLAKVLGEGDGPDEPAVGEEIVTAIESDRGGSSATQAGSVLGTPSYMPPEQAIGAIDQIDQRSDVFGLGAILCAVLTGKPPYDGAGFEATRQMAARARLGDAFARLDACGADPGLVELCKRCLAAEKADRPADAGEVAQAVADLRAAANERVRAAELDRVRAEGEAREQRKRRRVQAALGLAFAALLAVGGAFAWWARENQLATETEVRDRRTAAERDVSRAEEAASAARARAVAAGRDPALWAEARAAARQAVERAAALDASAEVRDRVGRLAAEVEQQERNRRLVATLLEIRAGLGDELTPSGVLDFAGTAGRYERAFRDYGADPLALAPEAAADLLRALSGDACVDVAAALDDWAYVRSAAQHVSQRTLDTRLRMVGSLFGVTRLLDPDPVRNQLRAAIVAGDDPALVRLGQEIDPAAHPTQTINLAAVFLPWNEPQALDAAVRLLGRAQPHHPGDFHVNHNLAFFLLNHRRFADAPQYAAAAVAVRPKSALAWHTWAVALAWTGRRAEAAEAYRRVYALCPQNLTSRVLAAAMYDRVGDPTKAAAVQAELDRLTTNPAELAFAYYGLGRTLRADDDPSGAEAAFRAAIRHAGSSLPEAYGQLALLLRQRGDLHGAVAEYRAGITALSTWDEGHNDLAWILATGPDGIRNGEEAVRLATTAAKLNPGKNANFLDTLAAAYAEIGNFDKAILYENQALEAAKKAGRPGTNIQMRLALYQRNQKYRDPNIHPETAPSPRAREP